MKFDGASGDKQDAIRNELVHMIEQLRTVKFPNLIYKKSIISGFGIGASVAGDVAFGHFYDTYSPFGSVVLIGFGYVPGSLTIRRFAQDPQTDYGLAPLAKYNNSFDQIAHPYIRLNLISGSDQAPFNDTSKNTTWAMYCGKMSLDCVNHTLLNCSHYDLMSESGACGYVMVKKIITEEMKALTHVEVVEVQEELTKNELNEALTSTWTLTSASLIILSGQVGFTLLELAQT